MSRLFSIALALALALSFGGCNDRPENVDNASLRGVWISCYELDTLSRGEQAFRAEFEKMVKTVKNIGINAVFVHVHSHADAIYSSSLFPSSRLFGRQGEGGFDALKIMVDVCRKNNVEIHAWVNPFRILSSGDTDDLCDEHIAVKWANDKQNAECVKRVGDGLYFNPSCEKVRRLICDAVKEIVSNYDVDGVHFDDYFYPTASVYFDRTAYNEYCKKCAAPLPLADFRRACITEMICSVHRICAEKGVAFGVSPQANNDNNYERLFLDVSRLISLGALDYVAPQIYFSFGFDYVTASGQKMAFSECFNYWRQLVRGRCKLYVGLGLYKANTDPEWSSGDMISRQISASSAADGIIIFSYSYLVADECETERKNIIKTLKNG